MQRKGSNTHHIPSMLVRTMDREPAPGEVRAEYVHDISNHEQAARESSIDVDFFPVKTEIEDQMDVKVVAVFMYVLSYSPCLTCSANFVTI